MRPDDLPDRLRSLLRLDRDDSFYDNYSGPPRHGVLKEGNISKARHIFFTKYPNISKHQTRASQQPQSFFLGRLPAEIREQIYLHIWREAGLTQHVFIHPKGGYTHSPCITDHYAPDDRQTEIDRIWKSEPPLNGFLDNIRWNRRLGSEWCNHWRCEELAAVRDMTYPEPSPFLPLLLSCKVMYLECRYSIYKYITFAFTRVRTACDYLLIRKSPGALSIQKLCFSFLFPSTIDGPEDNRGIWKREIAPWQQLCAGLAQLSQLRQIDIWVDSLDCRCREFLLQTPRLFNFNSQISPFTTINIAANVSRDLKDLRGQCTIIRRDCPTYHWDWTEISIYDWYPVVHRSRRSRRRIFRFAH